MANQYTWITYLAARQALAARLADPAKVFWSDTELGLYLIEALRAYNALCEVWNADFIFTATSAATWYNFSTQANSPRIRTLHDSDLYTIMQYHLLEPPTGAGPWTGTSQFSLADLQGALQRRRDEMIQVAACNLTQLPALASTPNIRRTQFPDTVLEPVRVRFVPAAPYGSPVTLNREDTLAFDAFQPQHLQTPQLPAGWSVISGPPLAMDTNTAPNVPGSFDVIALQSGPTFAPPAQTLLGIPDDWAWVAKFGALADLLSRDSEATDHPRAAYCLKRYTDGLKAMRQSNWLLTATIGGVPVDTPSLRELDAFLPEWQDNATAGPGLVTAGMDFVAPYPVATGSQNVGVSAILVGNAPVPVLDGDFVQCSRDSFDSILSYAQVLASFKMGGSEFASTKDLEKEFFMAAIEQNKRLSKLGLFSDVLHAGGKRQNIYQPR